MSLSDRLYDLDREARLMATTAQSAEFWHGVMYAIERLRSAVEAKDHESTMDNLMRRDPDA